ncbi:DUF4124 domain-containing protein [Litorivivens sp.]|uniref:DUF4124 domain-containing protein n=1 Tax=Litorivivens sp. TaxID=2020868 RepID=UPI003562CC33
MLKRLALALLIIVAGSAVTAKTGYYRWVDDNGQPHFTQKPPLDRPSTFIPTGRGYSDDSVNPPYPPKVPAKRADSGTEPAPEKPEKNKEFEVLPDKDPARCEQARKALQNFSRGQRVRVKDDNGEYRVLDSEEQSEQMKKAQEAVDIYC